MMSLQSGLSRRWFLQGAAGVAAAAALRPRRAAAEGKVLRVRSYSDIQVLDPAFRLSQNEDDIFQPCLVSLVTRKTGDGGTGSCRPRNRSSRSTTRTSSSS
jgi:peptide/nickel transport system substrate-binding protein